MNKEQLLILIELVVSELRSIKAEEHSPDASTVFPIATLYSPIVAPSFLFILILPVNTGFSLEIKLLVSITISLSSLLYKQSVYNSFSSIDFGLGNLILCNNLTNSSSFIP